MSDRVVVLEDDARTHTVQHTLISDGVIATLTLPGSVIPQRVVFGGPERLLFRTSHAAQPGRLSLWSGTAFARYRHQYGDAVQSLDPMLMELTASSVPAQLQIDTEDADGTPASVEVSSTWMFPADMDVIGWQAEPADGGSWIFDSNSLEWRQQNAIPATLTIRFRPRAAQVAATDAAQEPAPVTTASPSPPARDEDDDGVNDDGDVCLGAVTEGVPTHPEADATAIPGCDGAVGVVLEGLGFATGESYLDLPARRVLDRVAVALSGMADEVFEIAAHTDSVGTQANNLRLSSRRARAVRQYLLLRGARPGQLNATGYGESLPLADNASVDGRRSNRRVELRPFSDAEARTR